MQLAARTPANAAMCAGTVDALAGWIDGKVKAAEAGREGMENAFPSSAWSLFEHGRK